jgi:ATP-dependent Lon protease
MSKILDDVLRLREIIKTSLIPVVLETRILDQLEEITRLENEISSRVFIEQSLRYIELVTSLPWNKRTEDILDLEKANTIFEKNHYGLRPVKDRILEYLAILKLNFDRWQKETLDDKLSHAILVRRAPILCLVGLVGTGKTTLAKSIAESMNRKFVRIAFGGMSSALDLRGQSRVRPDAEVGLIIKAMRYAGSKNPVILLDEIDRVSEKTRGDIMGVLVELLDPEQNNSFTDHYLDFPFDLSEVLFVATANNTINIATAVLDRLEPIQMPSYSDSEKIKIAKDYVLPEILRESGLTSENIIIAEEVWQKLVRPLGYDAGIRSLERTINSICRKVARMIVEGKGNQFTIDNNSIQDFIDVY